MPESDVGMIIVRMSEACRVTRRVSDVWSDVPDRQVLKSNGFLS